MAKIKERVVELIVTLLLTPFIILAAKFTPDDFIKRVNPLTWFWLVISLFLAQRKEMQSLISNRGLSESLFR
ncbi:MAG: hypothetical protein AAB256_03945 [Deltaproteobacteria bacterium]